MVRSDLVDLETLRLEVAKRIAAADGVTLHDIKSTVGPPDKMNNWRRYLGLADAAINALEGYVPDETQDGGVMEDTRLKAAIKNYARHQPLDLLRSFEIQRDLLAIAGAPHPHRASIGSDECALCGLDLRHPVHMNTDDFLKECRRLRGK